MDMGHGCTFSGRIIGTKTKRNERVNIVKNVYALFFRAKGLMYCVTSDNYCPPQSLNDSFVGSVTEH